MAKQITDNKTAELLPTELAPVPARRGRKPKGEKAMTPAERMKAMRDRKKAKWQSCGIEQDVEWKLELQRLAALRHMTLRDLRDFLNKIL